MLSVELADRRSPMSSIKDPKAEAIGEADSKSDQDVVPVEMPENTNYYLYGIMPPIGARMLYIVTRVLSDAKRLYEGGYPSIIGARIAMQEALTWFRTIEREEEEQGHTNRIRIVGARIEKVSGDVIRRLPDFEAIFALLLASGESTNTEIVEREAI